MNRNMTATKIRVRCEAILKTGKQCSKLSLSGYSFCRVHGFGKLKDCPWYENGIFLTVMSVVVGFFIAWYFFLKGPTAGKQDKILAKQEASISKQDETLEIIRGMEAFRKENDPELKAKFNLGYVLFTATERKQVVPLKSPMDDILKFDWASGYSVSFTESTVTLRLPNITIHPQDSGMVEFNNSSVTLLRRFEPWARPGIFNNGRVRVAFKVVATNESGIMIAVGMQSPPEPRPPLSELRR